jgi:hypothetical protein
MKSLLLLLAGLAPLAVAAAEPACTVPELPNSAATQRTAEAATALRATNPCKLVPGIRAKSLASVWARLLSSTKLGGRRLDTEVPPGLPNGLVLARGGMVRFDFSVLGDEKPRALRVSAGTRVLAEFGPLNSVLDLPVGKGAADTDYTWSLVTDRGSYRGSFTLLGEAERADVERQLAGLAGALLDDTTRLLYTAAVYDEADLYSERERALLQARRLMQL